MKTESINRRLRRVQAAIKPQLFRAFVYDVFMLPGGKVTAVFKPGDNYQEDNNADWLDLIVYTPEPGDAMPPPRKKDLTAEYKENHKEHYERGLKKWRTDRLSAEVTAGK